MDKNKIIEAAAKLVAKGAYDKAIKEYRRLLEADPKDVRVLQKMGELFQKKNDNEQAATYFTKVAESYSTDGFFLKAVALYKQVLKLNPTLIDVNLRLAELHQQLQLISEATSYYQVVAQQYEKSGNIRSSLDTYKKVIDLDPENVSSRIKLGEMYARSHLKAEAAAEFKRAAEQLKRNGRMDEYQRVLDRVSALDGDNLALAREVAQRHLAEGDAKRAIAKLQQCFKANPHDEHTLALLAEAFAAIGQVSKTASVWKELVKIYASQGRTAEASELKAKLEQLRGAASQRRSSPQPAKGPSPQVAAAASSPASQHPQPLVQGAPALTPELLAKLLKETDVYLKYGLHHKALEHLGKIFAGDPENLDAHEKAYQIYVEAGDEAQAAEQLLNVLRLCTRLGAVERAKPYLNAILQHNPDHPEVPTFVSVLGGEPSATLTDAEVLTDDAILVDAADEEVVLTASEELDQPTEDLALEASVGEMTGEDVALSFSEELASSDEVDAASALPTVIVDAGLGADSVVMPADDLLDPAGEWGSQEPGSQPVEEAPVPEYELQLDDAEESERSRGREQPVGELTVSPPGEPAESSEVYEADPAGEECEEARFFLDQGQLDEAREILQTVLIAYPGYEPAQELLALVEQRQELEEASSGPPSEERSDAFDLAAELASEMGQLEDDQVAPAAPAAGDFQYSVDEVFAEFKKGLAKVVRPEDVDTHYDLGIAYREMGLIDDAIGEFTIARESCLGTKKEIDCWTMIALLQKTNGDPAAAVESYKCALLSEHAVGETQKALEFELGVTWEGLGEPGKALYHFARVAKLDGQYRDVASIISRLSLTAKPEPDPLPRQRRGGAPPPANGTNGVHSPGSAADRASSKENSEKSRSEALAAAKARRARSV